MSFALLHRTERPPNRQNLNCSLWKSAIGEKSIGSWETGNEILAYDRCRVPVKDGTRNLSYARIPFPLSEKTRFCQKSEETPSASYSAVRASATHVSLSVYNDTLSHA